MAITSIVRAEDGDSQREVQLSEIKILDFRVFPLFLPDERWIKAVAVYYEELSLFLASVRLDLHLSEEFFVPDLWEIATFLTPAQATWSQFPKGRERRTLRIGASLIEHLPETD